MSLRLVDEMKSRAYNEVGNMFSGTVALIRPRLIRWLGLLVSNVDNKTRSIIAKECFQLTSYLMRRKKLAVAVREQIRAVYTDFDPEQHYAKIMFNRKGEEKSRTPIPIENVPKPLVYARHMWHITTVHDRLVDRWMESLELFADGLFEMTGTALIQKMQDFSGKTNFAIDPRVADEISSEIFAEEALVEDEK